MEIDNRESDFDITKDTKYVRFQPNHQLMARPRIRERDFQPQRIFFYKRIFDNKTMIFTEQEAALMLKSTHGPYLQPLGCSDGTAYRQSIQTCGIKSGERIPQEKAQEILNNALAAELESAKHNIQIPEDQNVHFPDNSFAPQDRKNFTPPK